MKKSSLILDELNSVEIVHQGAHPSSWIHNGLEQFFVSNKAIFQKGKAIRGGVPLIFPQFGNFGPYGKHGFARTQDWEALEKSQDTMEFTLSDSPVTRDIWPYKFKAYFNVKLSQNSLEMTLKVTNTGNDLYTFSAALHSYFRIADIHKTKIAGLKDSVFWDNDGSDFNVRKREERSEFTLTEMMDRVYFDVDENIKLVEEKQTREIISSGFRDVVVWNPWLEGAQELADMYDDEYRHMICIESAQIDQPVALDPGKSWEGKQIITLI